MIREIFNGWLSKQLKPYDRFQYERSFRSAGLSKGECATLSTLQFFANREGYCAPAVATIGQKSGYSGRRIIYFTKLLARKGWLSIKRAASIWHTNIYLLRDPNLQSENSNSSQVNHRVLPDEAPSDKQNQTNNFCAHSTFEKECEAALQTLPSPWRQMVAEKLPVLIARGRNLGKPKKTIERAIREAVDRVGVEPKLTSSRIMNIFYKYVMHARVLEYDHIPINPILNEKKSMRVPQKVHVSGKETASYLKELLGRLKTS